MSDILVKSLTKNILGGATSALSIVAVILILYFRFKNSRKVPYIHYTGILKKIGLLSHLLPHPLDAPQEDIELQTFRKDFLATVRRKSLPVQHLLPGLSKSSTPSLGIKTGESSPERHVLGSDSQSSPVLDSVGDSREKVVNKSTRTTSPPPRRGSWWTRRSSLYPVSSFPLKSYKGPIYTGHGTGHEC